MSLVRFLPTPSDRMGIIWSLLAVQGAIVLEALRVLRITAWAYTAAWACAFKTACSLRI